MSKATDRYLYTIRTLNAKHPRVRSIDVAKCLGLSKATVCITVRKLCGDGLVTVEEDGHLQLSGDAMQRADKLCERAVFFQKALADAGVEPSLAWKDAVAFGWEMSETSFEAFRSMLAARHF